MCALESIFSVSSILWEFFIANYLTVYDWRLKSQHCILWLPTVQSRVENIQMLINQSAYWWPDQLVNYLPICCVVNKSFRLAIHQLLIPAIRQPSPSNALIQYLVLEWMWLWNNTVTKISECHIGGLYKNKDCTWYQKHCTLWENPIGSWTVSKSDICQGTDGSWWQ